MAIVKILNSSKSFSAVAYNESRVNKGEAQLICASNFPVGFNTPELYKTYLQNWSSFNSHIKNPQFHVVISLKGKESNPEELVAIAREWLTRMGYSNNPYLIYHHTNTDNSHIHIVTTRVGEDGRKIDHNFERKKSQRILNEINGIDKLHELRVRLSSLLRFSFSTIPQFVELCKDSGINVSVGDKDIHFELDSKSVNLSKELIEFCSKRYKLDLDVKYKKSLQAKIFKYAALLDKDTFKSYMRKNFGLNFVFYGRNDSIYGFTIIDYKKNSVYKGSEVFSLKKLNELFTSPHKTYQDKYNLLLKDFIKENKFSDISDVNKFFIKQNIFTDGVSYYELPQNELIGYVDGKLSNKLIYNTRVNKILCDYKPITANEKKVLSKIYHVSLKDLDRPINYELSSDTLLYYKGMIQDLLQSGSNIKETLDLYNIEVHFLVDSFVLRDASNKIVVSNDRLGVDYNQFRSAIKSFDDRFDFGQKFEDEYVGIDYDYEPEVVLSDILAGLFTVHAGVSSGSGRRKKKS